jgi:hypothetical protein
MDFGDLLFLILISIGVLSSLLGGKKKKRPTGTADPRPQQHVGQGRPPGSMPQGRRPEREMRRQVGPTVVDPADAAAARDAGSGHPATPLNHFERILQELGLEQDSDESEAGRPPPPQPPPAGWPPPGRPEPHGPDRQRRQPLPPPPPPPPPQAVRRPVVADQAARSVELAGARHEEFHERYVQPLSEPARVRKRARARIRPTHSELREAVLWREILGPPKGLE